MKPSDRQNIGADELMRSETNFICGYVRYVCVRLRTKVTTIVMF